MDARYTPVAAILHWTIAALIIGQLVGGFYMHGLPNSSAVKFDLYQLHKSFGFAVLFLSLVRLGWRFSHKAPPLPAAMPDWQKLTARAAHWAFYVLMILTPLAGWAIVSVSPTDIPTKIFGFIPVPHLPFFSGVADREAAEHLFEEQHEFLAKLIIALLILHVGAALKHIFVDKDGVFISIIPEKAKYWLGIVGIFAVLGAGAIFYMNIPPPLESTSAVEDQDIVPVHNNAAGNWAVDYGQSELAFIGDESGTAFKGTFEEFSVIINFDPDNLAAANIEVTVATASAQTGSDLRDSTTPGTEWFDVKNHPLARFEAGAVRALGNDQYMADGSLAIKEFTQPVRLQFELVIDGENAHARGQADLVRTDFGLGEASSWLDDEGVALEVRVEFDIRATRKD